VFFWDFLAETEHNMVFEVAEHESGVGFSISVFSISKIDFEPKNDKHDKLSVFWDFLAETVHNMVFEVAEHESGVGFSISVFPISNIDIEPQNDKHDILSVFLGFSC
jgi:hypothetical protein